MVKTTCRLFRHEEPNDIIIINDMSLIMSSSTSSRVRSDPVLTLFETRKFLALSYTKFDASNYRNLRKLITQ